MESRNENPLFDPNVADDTPVTVEQITEYSHASRTHIYALVRAGKLPYIKGMSRYLLFRVKDVKDLMSQMRVDPTTPEFPNNKNQPTPA